MIDDLIATGGTAEAAAKLIEISKGKVASFVFVINLFDLGGSDNLISKNYNVEYATQPYGTKFPVDPVITGNEEQEDG